MCSDPHPNDQHTFPVMVHMFLIRQIDREHNKQRSCSNVLSRSIQYGQNSIKAITHHRVAAQRNGKNLTHTVSAERDGKSPVTAK